jgi:DNA-binding CsgD family transcriptional regulator
MWRRPGATALLVLVLFIQSVCSLFFVWDIGANFIGVQREPLSWEMRELLEIGASVGLLLGVALGAALLVRTMRDNRTMRGKLSKAAGAFSDLLEDRFSEWGLTPSERDVAWFTIKGMSIAEIGRLRETSEGTVKAQSNAIYRKAGVVGRTQLLSLFIEDLMDDVARSEEPRRQRRA